MLQVTTALVVSAGIAKGIVQASSIALTLLAGYVPAAAAYTTITFAAAVI